MLNIAVINQVAMLFLIMGIGVIARKKKILKDEVKKGITELILNISLPCMIIRFWCFIISKICLQIQEKMLIFRNTWEINK